MRKMLMAFVIAAAILVPSRQAQAIIGVGLHVGQDSYSIASNTYSNLFGISGINLVREEMAQPFGIGGYLYIDFIPIIDLELGIDLYGNIYNYTFANPVTGDDYSEELAWARTTTWLSIQKKILKVPMFKLYAGGGLNFNASLPIVDKDFIEDFLGNQDASLEPEDILDEVASNTGFHAELGLRFKPILIPLSIHVRYRMTFVEGIVPGESSFSTLMIGGGIQF